MYAVLNRLSTLSPALWPAAHQTVGRWHLYQLLGNTA